MRLTEWIYDAGIGEDRAILIEGGKIAEARIERHDGIKPGAIMKAQLATRLIANSRGIVRMDDGSEALLSPLPKGVDEGASLMVEVTRTAIDEKSRHKLPQVRASSDAELCAAPTLLDRIAETGIPVRQYHAYEPDSFEEHGWGEVLEEARSGIVGFPGGTLQIALTPAMTLIDIDGDVKPVDLALAAAKAVAAAIRRLDIQGNIGVDFPALTDKLDRNRVAEAFDDAMVAPCERTAINGFGFMQIVTRRARQSLSEMLHYRSVTAHTFELLRRAERHADPGAMQLVTHPAITAKLEQRPEWIAELARRTGRAVSLRVDAKLAMGGGYAETVR